MKEDIRITKTKKALKISLIDLLKTYTMEKISITNICSNANVNRVTFYSHYRDKYELFSDCIKDITTSIVPPDNYEYKSTEYNDIIIEYTEYFATKLIDIIDSKKDLILKFGNQENSSLNYLIQKVSIEYSTKLFAQIFKDRVTKYPVDIIATFILGGISNITYVMIKNPKDYSKVQIKSSILTLIKDLLSSAEIFIEK